MAEKEMIVADQRITYEGIFSLDELHKLITEWLEQKKYDRMDKLHTESIRPDGKYVDIVLEPDKMIDDYTDLIIRIRMYVSQLKEVMVEMDGRKRRLNTGKIQIVLDAWVKTDYQGRMESKPIYQFMQTLYDKYIFKTEMSKQHSQLKGDVAHLKESITNYLNLFKHI